MTPGIVSCQAPLSMEFSRQEYWSGLPFASPGELLDPGIESGSPKLQVDSLQSEPPGKPNKSIPLFKHQAFEKTTQTVIKQTPLSSSILQILFKFISTESEILSNHLILCCQLLLLSSIFPSIRILSNESDLHIR